MGRACLPRAGRAATFILLAVPIVVACQNGALAPEDDAHAAGHKSSEPGGGAVISDGEGEGEGAPLCVPDSGTLPAGQSVPHHGCSETTKDVDSAEAILAILEERPEIVVTFHKPPKPSEWNPGDNLRVTKDLDLDLTAFRVAHPACQPDAGTLRKCLETYFGPGWTGAWQNTAGPREPPSLPKGVTCGTDCTTTVHIAANTTFRIQRRQETNGVLAKVEHIVEIVEPCGSTCTTPEISCAAAGRCVGFLAYCLGCAGNDRATCACFGRCNGTECDYDSSEDVSAVGTCQSDECVAR